MRIYEYNESDKTLNTECGLFHIGDTVQIPNARENSLILS